MTTTKTRKKPTPKPDLSAEELPKRLQIINKYASGTSIEDLSEEFGWSINSVRKEINEHFNSLKTIMETESLVAQQKADMSTTGRTSRAKVTLYKNHQKLDKDINSKFVEKLSDPEDSVLTQEENLFCYLMVHEGDELKALTDSGLAEGLMKSARTYKRAAKLRCLMLKGKPNLLRYMNELQINYVKELNVNKEMVVSEIISQLRQLREQNDPKNAPTIAKLTEMLGKAYGTFTDNVRVGDLDFDGAMDMMMKRREEKQKAIPAEAGGGEEPTTYVYDPEAIG